MQLHILVKTSSMSYGRWMRYTVLEMYQCQRDGSRVRVLERHGEIAEHKVAMPTQATLLHNPRLLLFTVILLGLQLHSNDMLRLIHTLHPVHPVIQVLRHHHQFITVVTRQGTLCPLNTYKTCPLLGGIRTMNNCFVGSLREFAIYYTLSPENSSSNGGNVIGLSPFILGRSHINCGLYPITYCCRNLSHSQFACTHSTDIVQYRSSSS